MEQDKLIAEYVRGAFLYATEALRSLIYLSGGASAALFMVIAYLTANGFFAIGGKLILPAGIFFASAIIGSATFGLSYLAQICFIQFGASKSAESLQGVAVSLTVVAFGGCVGAMVLAYRVIVGV
jgi:hypothetical protein